MRERKPKNLPGGHFTAHIGQNFSWGDYCGSYQGAVEALWSQVAEMKATPDRLALPLLFLVRHTVELGYKAALADFYSALRKGKVPEDHQLKVLHRNLGAVFDELVNTGWVSPDSENEFRKRYSATRQFKEWLLRWDAANDAFRY